AAYALQSAAKVIVLGYSLPPADAPTRTMMSIALKRNNKLDTVKVVLGSDWAAFTRWADFSTAVGKRLEPVYTTFEDFTLGKPPRL
ncbi:MAG: hypothetical protein ACREJJ_01145, partial [Candidatus Methylomirabilales bacterium]